MGEIPLLEFLSLAVLAMVVVRLEVFGGGV